MKLKTLVKYMDKFVDPVRKPLTDTASPKHLTAKEIFSQMTDDEKILYIGGVDGFAIRGIDRLGVPKLFTSDATSGSRGWDAPVTIFPSNVAMTATFNKELMHDAAYQIGREARALGIQILLAPGINIARVPTNGRNFEYMGEDPYLAGQMAAAYIKGAQEGGVGTTVKHFACNNSDYDRHKSNSVVDERALHEIYLPAFKMAIEAGSLGIMTSYNQLNGEYASQNQYLIDEVLRKQWGFDGFVISDWTSVYDTVAPLKCGVDLEMPKAKFMSLKKVKKALKSGKVTMADIDKKVLNLLNALEKLGAFSRPIVDTTATVPSQEAKNVSLKTAQEAIVLLKNEKALLPFDVDGKKIVLLGCQSRTVPTGGGGSSFIIAKKTIENLSSALSQRGATVTSLESNKWQNLSAIVKDADLVIVQTGFNRILESENYDRSYAFSIEDQKAINEISKINDKLLVIVHSGGDYDTEGWIDSATSVLNAYYLGENSSEALCDVIDGTVNPSGRLVHTIAKGLNDYQSVRNYYEDYDKFSFTRMFIGQGHPKLRKVKDIKYAESIMVGYRDFQTNNKEVRYPFGYGLSYTSFEYSDLSITEKDRQLLVTAKIKNNGKVAGAEVVQLYIHPLSSSVFRPYSELKGFEKVFLEPNEEKVVSFVLKDEDFSYYEVDNHSWCLDEGEHEIMLCSNSDDVRLSSIINR